MVSANRKYKDSGSKKSFKKWLNDEQKSGRLIDHADPSVVDEPMLNADGDSEPIKKVDLLVKKEPVVKEDTLSLASKGMNRTNNVIGILSVGLLAYGLMTLAKKVVVEE